MRINYEAQRPTESMAIERTHSKKAVKEIVKEVIAKASEVKKGAFEVQLPFEPTRAEMVRLGHRLQLYHGLEIIYQHQDGEHVTLTVQRYKRQRS